MNLFRPVLLALGAAVALTACASTGLRDAEKLELYRAHSGEPVPGFNFYRQIIGWTPLGDSALAVWTKPSEAWLLELAGPCPDLEYTPAIGLTSNMGRVYARFDQVQVRGMVGGPNMPCHIASIRPLDLKAVRASEKELREASVQERAAGS